MRRIEAVPVGRRGSFLVQAMVFTVLFALIASYVVKLSFGRRVLLARVNSSESARQNLLGAESFVYSCVGDSSFGVTDCALPPACSPPAMDGRVVSVTALGNPPDCLLRFALEP